MDPVRSYSTINDGEKETPTTETPTKILHNTLVLCHWGEYVAVWVYSSAQYTY